MPQRNSIDLGVPCLHRIGNLLRKNAERRVKQVFAFYCFSFVSWHGFFTEINQKKYERGTENGTYVEQCCADN